MNSQLPEWMRNPAPPERTTIAWEIGQSWRRTRLAHAMRAFGERWRNRYRITKRFPKTTAVFAFFISIAVTVYIIYWMYVLLARVD